MQTIIIRDLKLETIIGVNAWERQVKQLLWLELEFSYDMQQAMAYDKVEYAVDYSQVTMVIIDIVAAKHYALIEALAAQIVKELVARFPMQWLKLKLTKPGALPQAKDVSIVIEHRVSSAVG
jgi:dihydroneopterin aldolase